MKKSASALSPSAPFTALDRILERVLDFFDEFDGLAVKGDAEYLDRTLATLEVLQLRLASALWLFGDTRRAYLLGFPDGLDEAQRATLAVPPPPALLVRAVAGAGRSRARAARGDGADPGQLAATSLTGLGIEAAPQGLDRGMREQA